MRSEFHNNASATDRMQDKNFNQINFKMNDTSKKNKKLTTNLESFDDTDALNKIYLDKNLYKM